MLRLLCRFHFRCVGLVAGFAALLPLSVPAAEAGAWERFPTQTNADAWSVYDFSADSEYYPAWTEDGPGQGVIYFNHTGDKPLWFFTDTRGNAGGGALVGDYAAERIVGIQCDVEIASLEDFDALDFVIRSSGSGEDVYYYSQAFYAEDFDVGGWWTLWHDFDADWFEWDEEGNQWVAVELTHEILSEVAEIGFRFFPKAGTTAETHAALADVKLVPSVDPVVPAVSTEAGEFVIRFTPAKANECKIERKQGGLDGKWTLVPGQSGILGPDGHRFATPIGEVPEFFRILAEEHYTPIVTVP